MTDWSPATRRAVGLAELSRARKALAEVTQPSHDQWQGQVVQLAKALGWSHLHVRKSIGKAKKWATTTNIVGFPDLLLWHHRHGFAAIECKVGKDKPTPEQTAVLAGLAAAGARTMVAYPDDLPAVKALLGRAA